MNKVSIVIPTYKRPDYLDRLLNTIQAQTFQGFEVIVIDDSSPNYNDYLPIIEKYTKIFNEFIFMRNETNRGAPYSRNRGILESKYDLIALVDDDDEWLPEKLEKQVRMFEENDNNLGLVYTWTDAVDEDGKIVYRYRAEFSGNTKKEILKECFIPSPSVMVRKEAIKKAGLFDEKFPSCQDWDMWTNIIMGNYKIKVLPEVLALHNKHNQISIGMSSNATIGYYKYCIKHLTEIRNELGFLIAGFRYFKAVKNKFSN